MKKIRLAAALLAAVALLCGCAARQTEPSGPAAPSGEDAAVTVPAAAPEPWQETARTALENMTLPEKVGQLFFVRPDALDPGQTVDAVDYANSPGVREMSPAIGGMMERYKVGGVVIFDKNVASPEQLSGLICEMQDAAKVPLIFAVDEEGGAVSRLAASSRFDVPRFPPAAAMGAAGDAGKAASMGRAVGEYLAMYGFAMDLAPVADVRTNPRNTVIGQRAFSDDPRVVTEMAGAMAEGLLSRGIIPVYKHFPGHGDTSQDSHVGAAVLHKTAPELRACEWLPYTENDLTGCAVMVGHIAVPEITGDMIPASLSEKLVTGVLRRELGFDGLVITDSLAMQGILGEYSPARAAVMALKAGCDVLLTPHDLPASFDAVLAAAERGEISESRLDESVLRILEYKARVGLLQ